jgi:hypothetical protein
MRCSRWIISILAVVVGMYSLLSPGRVEARSENVAFFYADLAPYGRWVDHPIYGAVWVPATHEPGWAPYSEGRWVWTTDYGWYWDSDEEFGWATYHYGRWVLTADLGWVWVPDEVWGPGWVDWRYSDAYVGWSPMPPEYRWRGGTFVAANIDLGAPHYASTWTFVSDSDFARGNVRGHHLSRERNGELIKASVRVTNYAAVDGRIVNRSIDRAALSARAKVRVAPVRVGLAASIADGARIKASGSVPLYRPHVEVRSKLNLDPLPGDTGFATDTGVNVSAPEPVDVAPRPPGAATGHIDLGAGADGILDRSGGGISLGGGGGIGGGVRLGR